MNSYPVALVTIICFFLMMLCIDLSAVWYSVVFPQFGYLGWPVAAVATWLAWRALVWIFGPAFDAPDPQVVESE